MRWNARRIEEFAAAVLEKTGLSDSEAMLFAESLVTADLRGVASHGVMRLGTYLKRIEAGTIKPNRRLKLCSETASTAVFDAQDGVGAVIGREMTDWCIRKAKETGCCVAAAKNGTHWGAASFYTAYAAEQRMIAIAFCNSEAAVVPYGGARPMLGTNPLSIAIPAWIHRPLVLDMATSMAARGKVVQAEKEGRKIPETWCVDANGASTTDPAEALKGAMLPFGGPKGYAISLIIDLICSCLGGALSSRETSSFWSDCTRPQNVGYGMFLLDVEKYMPAEVFGRRVDALLDEFKTCPPAPGFSEVLIPGEIEDANYEENLSKGIPLADSLIAELREIGKAYAVAFPEMEFSAAPAG